MLFFCFFLPLIYACFGVDFLIFLIQDILLYICVMAEAIVISDDETEFAPCNYQQPETVDSLMSAINIKTRQMRGACISLTERSITSRCQTVQQLVLRQMVYTPPFQLLNGMQIESANLTVKYVDKNKPVSAIHPPPYAFGEVNVTGACNERRNRIEKAIRYIRIMT